MQVCVCVTVMLNSCFCVRQAQLTKPPGRVCVCVCVCVWCGCVAVCVCVCLSIFRMIYCKINLRLFDLVKEESRAWVFSSHTHTHNTTYTHTHTSHTHSA